MAVLSRSELKAFADSEAVYFFARKEGKAFTEKLYLTALVAHELRDAVEPVANCLEEAIRIIQKQMLPQEELCQDSYDGLDKLREVLAKFPPQDDAGQAKEEERK